MTMTVNEHQVEGSAKDIAGKVQEEVGGVPTAMLSMAEADTKPDLEGGSLSANSHAHCAMDAIGA